MDAHHFTAFANFNYNRISWPIHTDQFIPDGLIRHRLAINCEQNIPFPKLSRGVCRATDCCLNYFNTVKNESNLSMKPKNM